MEIYVQYLIQTTQFLLQENIIQMNKSTHTPSDVQNVIIKSVSKMNRAVDYPISIFIST